LGMDRGWVVFWGWSFAGLGEFLCHVAWYWLAVGSHVGRLTMLMSKLCSELRGYGEIMIGIDNGFINFI
jgi:hypothetical protein